MQEAIAVTGEIELGRQRRRRRRRRGNYDRGPGELVHGSTPGDKAGGLKHELVAGSVMEVLGGVEAPEDCFSPRLANEVSAG